MSAHGGARALGATLAVAALAAPGALSGSRGAPDPCALLAWLALIAPAAGALAGGMRLAPWPHAACVPGAWALLVALVDASGTRDLATPSWAALACAGLYAAGFAVGRCRPSAARWHTAAAAFAFACAATALPLAGGVLRAAWPGPVAARLLDLSPATLVIECAGVDWLRHPAVYDAAGSVDIDPTLRSAWSPALASSLAFVVGCALAWAAVAASRRRERRAVS